MRAGFHCSAVLAGALLALASFSAGCSSVSSCTRDADFTTAAPGYVFGNTYISALNDGVSDGPIETRTRGPWAHFPPARTLTFEHNLGAAPPQISIWLAFQAYGVLAPSAGNTSILEFVDKEFIKIKNDTCSDFYVWVQASLPSSAAPQSQADASAEITWQPVSSEPTPPDESGAAGAAGASN